MKKNKGITLVALVITIIILLILAGMTISSLQSSGLFTKATQSKEKSVKSEMKEQLVLALSSLQTEKLGRATLDDVTEEFLKNEIKDTNIILEYSEPSEMKLFQFEKSGIKTKFLIDSGLNVVENVADDVIKSGSIIGKINKINKSGKYSFEIKDITYSMNVICYNRDVVLNGSETLEGATYNNNTYEFGDKENDVATATENAKNMVVLKVNGNLTINEGITVTSCKSDNGFGGPKGFLIYCTGKITNNGTVSMTARGAKADGENVYLWKNKDGSYEYVPALGGEGADGTFLDNGVANGSDLKYAGKEGNNANGNRSTGGGGTGGGYVWQKPISSAGKGSQGTSYSGGSGGGASSAHGRGSTALGTDAEANGGKGGNSGSGWNTYTTSGGAGNTTGTGSGNNGTQTGTGGLLIVYADQIAGNGDYKSDGSSANENWCASGGGSGAGSINIFANNILNTINSSAVGKTTTSACGKGGKGGDGSVTIGIIKDGTFVKNQ